MLRIRHLDAYYGDVQVLFDLDVTVGQGELVSIIGPNSAGKSTLLKTVLGLVRAGRNREDGGIFLDGLDLKGMSTEKIIAQGIAIVPEGASVFPEMSVYDNLYLGGYTKPERIREMMTQVFEMFPRIEERLSQKAKTLSGGERQMLCIGRALMAARSSSSSTSLPSASSRRSCSRYSSTSRGSTKRGLPYYWWSRMCSRPSP